jgi:H+/Cl- antiporter ClcA
MKPSLNGAKQPPTLLWVFVIVVIFFAGFITSSVVTAWVWEKNHRPETFVGKGQTPKPRREILIYLPFRYFSPFAP